MVTLTMQLTTRTTLHTETSIPTTTRATELHLVASNKVYMASLIKRTECRLRLHTSTRHHPQTLVALASTLCLEEMAPRAEVLEVMGAQAPLNP